MIDNIKLFALNKDEFEQNVCKKANIDFKAPYNINTGEAMDYPKSGKLENLEVRITPREANVKGSLHKFFNSLLEGEPHNHNDFRYNDLVAVIDEVALSLGLDSGRTKLTNLEFGFNIVVDKDPELILEKNVMMFNYKSHTSNKKFGGRGDYKDFGKTDYIIKVYNKSKQYNLDKYVLRVEVKIIMKRVLERLDIYTLDDLKDKEKLKLKNLFNFFMQNFEKLQIIDEFEHREDISSKDKSNLTKYTSEFYWKSIFDKSMNVQRMHLKQFERLIKKYKLDSLKQELRSKLQAKFDELIDS